MAEIIAAAAAIVQFVDVAVRLSSHLGRLCSEVRNVPHRFHRLQVDLRQQVEIAQHIQTNYLSHFATTVVSTTVDEFLLEYIASAEELCKTLEKLLANKDGGFFQRSWDGFCSLRKKEDVIQICDRLEQRKSTLSLWLNAANLNLSSNVATTADQIKLDVGETLTLAKTVKDSSSKAAAGTEQLLPQLKHMSQALANWFEQMMMEVQQVKAQSAAILADTGAGTQKSDRIDQASTRILSNTELILQNFQHVSSGSGGAGTGTCIGPAVPGSSATDIYRPRFESVDAVRELAHEENDATQRLATYSVSSQRFQAWRHNCTSEVDTHASSSRRCTCRTIRNSRCWRPFSIIHFTRTSRTQHYSFCPEYRSSERSFEFTTQLVPPSWLLSHTLDLGFQVKNWWTMKPFSISPIVIGTSRLVDSEASPAFRAIQDAEDEIYATGLHHICIAKLQNTLQELFVQQKASPLDVDRNGCTLLNKVLSSYVHYCRIRMPMMPGDEYVSLIQFLLDKGANPNIIKSTKAGHRNLGVTSPRGTILDEHAIPLAVFSGFSVGARAWAILKRLEAAGSEFSQPLTYARSEYQCTYFHWEVKMLIDFEDQIDLCELGGYVPLIMERSERRFQRAVRKAKLSDLNRQSPINDLAPIHFAVLWPFGLKILINKGANVNVEDKNGRRPIHLAVALGVADSVEYLLNADCSLFSPWHDMSLLQYALRLDNSDKQRLLDLLVAALIDRHARLLDMVIELLPCSSFSNLNMTKEKKRERQAPDLIEVLESYMIGVPQALELDGKSFYDSFNSYVDVRLTPDVANAFWHAGFKDINEPNRYGLTPMLQSWFCANFEMVAWFAQKGIPLSSMHRDTPLTGLHLYACHINTRYDTIIPTEKNCMERIQEEVGIPYDECTCSCSPSGCSPVTFLCKDGHAMVVSPKGNFWTWLKNVEPEATILRRYVCEFTRCLLFGYLGGIHTCCSLRYTGCIRTRAETYVQSYIKAKWEIHYEKESEHKMYCEAGIPIPRRDDTSSVDAGELRATLDSLMSHYDEMSRPDTMLPEEQPFHYLNWLIAEGYLVVDVKLDCPWCSGSVR